MLVGVADHLGWAVVVTALDEQVLLNRLRVSLSGSCGACEEAF